MKIHMALFNIVYLAPTSNIDDVMPTSLPSHDGKNDPYDGWKKVVES